MTILHTVQLLSDTPDGLLLVFFACLSDCCCSGGATIEYMFVFRTSRRLKINGHKCSHDFELKYTQIELDL